MAKSGYEKAAEVQEKAVPKPTEVTTNDGVAHDIVTGEKPMKRSGKPKKPPRRMDDDLRAINKIMAIIEEFGYTTSDRILDTCKLKIREKHTEATSVDPRAPGGILYTPPLPGMGYPDGFVRDQGQGHG